MYSPKSLEKERKVSFRGTGKNLCVFSGEYARGRKIKDFQKGIFKIRKKVVVKYAKKRGRERMANKRTRAVSTNEYNSIISTIRTGFTTPTGHRMKPHIQVATALICEINLGMRISDIIKLRLSDIIFEGGRYHLNNVIEQKTKKIRNFVVPAEVVIFLQGYALERGISPQDRLFSIGTRTVQNYLQRVCEYLGLQDVGSHSFRKGFAQALYANSGCNLEIIRQALNHSSIVTTQIYLGVNTEMVEQALENHVMLPA